MIKATGITAEYNPLHNGHVYQIEKAREITDCDVIAVAMSGDFVQRGEPAILDKWTRCGLALDAGADIVVEIPALFCLGNSAQYASASVRVLEALGCDNIAFGSESGDIDILRRTAERLLSNRDEIDKRIKECISKGLSWPAAREQAYRSLRTAADSGSLEKEISVLSDPNDILALEYLMNMRKAQPVCIKRKGAGYHEGLKASAGFQSAGAIRDALRNGMDTDELADGIPGSTLKALKESRLVFSDEMSELLRYAAMSTPAEMIERCPSAGEGLGNRLKNAALDHNTWEGIVKAAKSKRYTYTRISRLCAQLILGIDRDHHGCSAPEYIRVLGFNEKGRELLSRAKSGGNCDLPILTNINKEAQGLTDEARSMLELDVHATDIYNLVSGRDNSYSDHIMTPVIK